MKTMRIKTRIVALVMALVTTISTVAVPNTKAYAANSLPSNIFHLTGEMKTKADSIEAALVYISKLDFFKDKAVAYFGPALIMLDVYFGYSTTSLGDISNKLDNVNKEIQGKITKEADRVIDAMDCLPDAVELREFKSNLTALEAAVKNAQFNMSVDMASKSLTDEEKFRRVANELGTDPREWTTGSAVNGIEVLGKYISLSSKDMETAVRSNSTDNIYLSMYRYMCSKSLFSGEAIDLSEDFVNDTYVLYINASTTLLQYLYAKAEVATIDGDEDMLKKVSNKIDETLDNMINANRTYCEFFALNRLVFVNHKSDATKQIPLSTIIGHVNYKESQVQDMDAVFSKYSALSYEEVNAIMNQAKSSPYAMLKGYLESIGFNLGLSDAEITKEYNNIVTSKYYVTGATCSVPWYFNFKGMELCDASMSLKKVEYYQHRIDKDNFNTYDRRYMDGNGLFFVKDVDHKWVITNWKNSCIVDGIDVEFTCKNTGEVRTVKTTEITRVDNGKNPLKRTYTIKVYLDGKEYTDTREVDACDYEIVDWKLSSDFKSAEVYVKCTDCGKIGTIVSSDITRVDDNNETSKRTYTVKVMVDEKEYTNTKEFNVKNYEFINNGNDTYTLLINWGTYNNSIIDWSRIESKDKVTAIKIDKGVNLVGDCSNMFNGLKNCNSIDMQGVITKDAMSMNGMFAGCESLEMLDLSSFETGYVFDMTGMFSGCEKLKVLNLEKFDTRFVNHNYENMFEGCDSLEKLTISDNMSITTDMALVAKNADYRGWANENDLSTIVTGRDNIATISGAGTYIHVAY